MATSGEASVTSTVNLGSPASGSRNSLIDDTISTPIESTSPVPRRRQRRQARSRRIQAERNFILADSLKRRQVSLDDSDRSVGPTKSNRSVSRSEVDHPKIQSDPDYPVRATTPTEVATKSSPKRKTKRVCEFLQKKVMW
ncbi:hypothetical protein CAPTEDRAFT_196220 [Capitella teleta]|uniref:Uncharacterized protein n=1 Tax=Capitella teleta TaxID=283909 RepID=R7TZZ1_CAPTE|nr:hypothetical protein CAPTEDRAFT_196220 [Capitella teleta]|eukprot:ELT99523.1 hypothetical protein CAPTEDRAFT_196220 [Capitella teleta]